MTNPKSPTFTDPSREKKILDGCVRKEKTKSYEGRVHCSGLLDTRTTKHDNETVCIERKRTKEEKAFHLKYANYEPKE